MGVRPGELGAAVNSKRVIPHHPVSGVKADLLRDELQFGRVLITDRQPKCPIALENSINFRHPLRRPGKVLLLLQSVVVFVVFIPDIKRGIGKHQVDGPVWNLAKPRHAIAMMDFPYQRLDL